jgi:large subunit ribosomal protein L18e
MGVDLIGVQKSKHFTRRHTDSTNPYIKLLVKLYKFLAKRTKSPFNQTVYERLLNSRRNRAPISLSRLAIVLKRKSVWNDPAKTKAPIAVVVGDVLDDIRINKLPKIRVCALRFSQDARKRIEGAGGECITFDQLATIAPTGKNTFLMRGRRSGRETLKHFGNAGHPGGHARPYVSSKGAECSRGRRPNKGYKRKAFKHM